MLLRVIILCLVFSVQRYEIMLKDESLRMKDFWIYLKNTDLMDWGSRKRPAAENRGFNGLNGLASAPVRADLQSDRIGYRDLQSRNNCCFSHFKCLYSALADCKSARTSIRSIRTNRTRRNNSCNSCNSWFK